MTGTTEAALGYLGWHELADGKGYTGGLLVVSDEGFPQEFRCTEPIRASTVQAILYGDSFRTYMFRTLIGENLWSYLSLKPPVLMINDQWLRCVAEEVPVPVAHVELIEGEGEIVQVEGASEPSDRFTVGTPRGNRVAVAFVGPGLDRAADCRALVMRCAEKMDLYEPFGRVKSVLECLERQKSREL